MIKHFALKSLSTALNKTLSLDPAAFDRLKKLNGHCAKIEIVNHSIIFYLHFTETGCLLTETPAQEPDITISGKVNDLFKFSRQKEKNLYQSHIKITGDMGLGEELQLIFKKIDIDWEEGLANYTGDIAARKISDVFQAGKKWSQQFRQNIRDASKEYWQEEIRILPQQDEVDHFCQQVTQLRSDVDRLALRIQHLQGKK